MPTNHDETLLQRYQRETREIEARAFIHPEFGGVAKRKLDDLQAKGYTVVGYMLARAEADYTVTRGAIDIGGMVIWWNPEPAAPAAQPEPVAWRIRQGMLTSYISHGEFVSRSYDTGEFTPLYLGIKEQP